MVVIIDYKMGNIASVRKAFEKLDQEVKISNESHDIEQADYLVLPGIGAFGDGIKNLKNFDLINLLNKRVLEDKVPFLGICIGLQLLAEQGHEFGLNQGLGWIKGEVVKLKVNNNFRLPHIGWNNIEIVNNHILFGDLPDNNFYFVHSYHLKCADESIVSAWCDYGERFVAALQKDNIFATQFHPEKSQEAGLKVLQNFINSTQSVY